MNKSELVMKDKSDIRTFDCEDTLVKLRNNKIKAKIRAFEVLPDFILKNSTNKGNPNWWIGIRNDQEYVRESLLFSDDRELANTFMASDVIPETDNFSKCNVTTDDTVKNKNEHEKFTTEDTKTSDVDLLVEELEESLEEWFSFNSDILDQSQPGTVISDQSSSQNETQLPEEYLDNLLNESVQDETLLTQIENKSVHGNYLSKEAIIINNAEENINNNRMSLTFNSHLENNHLKLSRLIEEMTKLEENYILRLEKGINIYLKKGITLIEESHQTKYKDLFSNLLKIYDFHKDHLYQSLITCNKDIFNIANVFHTVISNDSFYPYILYQVDIETLETFILKNKIKFDQLSKQSGDILGIKNFLLEPTQRLTKYQLLFKEIVNLLNFNDEATKQFLSICCVTERHLKNLISTVDQAMSLRNLDNCSEVDWRQQGKFRKMSKLFIFDVNNNCSYKGNVYLFESCLIIQKCDKDEAKHRNVFTYLRLDDIQFIEIPEKSKIKLVMRRKKFYIIGSESEIQEWTIALKSVKEGDEKNDFLEMNHNFWNADQYIKVLTRNEVNFVSYMRLKKVEYLSDASNSLKTFITTMEIILDFHSIIIRYLLGNPQKKFMNICDTIKNYIKDGYFDAYKIYAFRLPHTFEHLFKATIISTDLIEFFEAPMDHIRCLKVFVNKVLKASINSKVDTVDFELVKCLAELQSELNRFYKMVHDTFIIHTKIITTNANIKHYGFVAYSDLVTSTTDKSKKKQFRLFIMCGGLIAISIDSKKNGAMDEEFLCSLKWHAQYPVTYEGNVEDPQLLKLYFNGCKNKSFEVIFQTTAQKQKFIEQLSFNLMKFVSDES